MRILINRRGFSAIELLILIAGALVIAGLSVPVLRGITLASNSESAQETLFRARDFQIRFHEKGIANNSAGAPRFGTWSELLQSGLSLEDAMVRDQGLLLEKHGYLFQMFFGVRAGDPTTDPKDLRVDSAKDRFVIYAWPNDRGRSGASAFAIDPSGMLRTPAVAGILESKNLLKPYSGLDHTPRWDAARTESLFRGGESLPSQPAKGAPQRQLVNFRGADGELWEWLATSAQ